MKLQLVGCTHHQASTVLREQLAFSPVQTREALQGLQNRFDNTEAVLLSTCNRVELYTYTAGLDPGYIPSPRSLMEFLADFHHLSVEEVHDFLWVKNGSDVVQHLFSVISSLDSMVLGESQILSQVRDAYDLAHSVNATGPTTHRLFQAAIRVARRVTKETTIHQRRISIASIAVSDFAKRIFERFYDKQILVIGAGKTAEETLRYLNEEGARQITVINRSPERAAELAVRWDGVALEWTQLFKALIHADFVISATGSEQSILSQKDYLAQIAPHRFQRPLFILDLAIPRDFDPRISECLGIYLYCLDDLSRVCQNNRHAREKELPFAVDIVADETRRFIAAHHHRTTAPVIGRLQEEWQEPKQQELQRLLNKLPDLDDKGRAQIAQSFDRLVRKLLHPAMETLKKESDLGPPHRLLDAIKRLFQLKD